MELVSFIVCDKVEVENRGFNLSNANRQAYVFDNPPFLVPEIWALATFRRLDGEGETQKFDLELLGPDRKNVLDKPERFVRFKFGVESIMLCLSGIEFPLNDSFQFVIRCSGHEWHPWTIHIAVSRK